MPSQPESHSSEREDQSEPPNGLLLMDAVQAFCKPELVAAWEEAWRAPGAHNRVHVHGSPTWRAMRSAQKASDALLHDLWSRLKEGQLVAWGALGSPFSVRQQLQADAWRYIGPQDLRASTLKCDDGQVIYAVRVVRRESIAEWQCGVSLARAAELLAPASWTEYQDNHCPVTVFGDTDSMEQRSRASLALKAVRKSIWAELEAGRLELRTLHPPGDPTAVWTALSHDVLSAHSPEDLGLKDSTLARASGGQREVRVFPAGTVNSSVEPRTTARAAEETHSTDKRPIYSRVAEAWDQLPEDTKQLVKTRGGKTEIARALHASSLPDVPLSSVERELRRRLSHLQESGKKAGK